MNILRSAMLLSLIFLFSLLINSCNSGHSPLPRGYVRIDLPQKEYRSFDTIYPYSFQYPVYGKIVPDKRSSAEPWWADVVFPQYKATIHLSYKQVGSKEELYGYFEDGRNFVNKHIPKSTGFNERVYVNQENSVFGILYEIRGPEAASPYQFYLTDSTSHFLRGALYFNLSPNNDSLAPVINFLHEDILYLIESLQWKEN